MNEFVGQPLVIRHRVNTIEGLEKIPENYGVEVDIRSYDGKLVLNHEPFEDGDALEEYLDHFKHAFIILEIKEEGIEKRVIETVEKRDIDNYFLLSVTPPFMIKLANEGVRKMAIRFSEFESLEMCRSFAGKIDWVWVDTFTRLPLDKESYDHLSKNFKICLVCPERWGRPDDIPKYIEQMKKDEIKIDAVMTAEAYVEQWENSGVLND